MKQDFWQFHTEEYRRVERGKVQDAVYKGFWDTGEVKKKARGFRISEWLPGALLA